MQKVISKNISSKKIIFFYLLIACAISPFSILSFDTYYYWDWSRHLDLSYYDGPPLIAYIIWIITNILGHSLFSLHLIAITFTILTTYIIYKTASLFLDKKNSYLTTLLWLTSPLVTQDMLVQVTYDTPLTFFWICSIYYTIIYLKLNPTLKEDNFRILSFIGISLGFLLLSKYTGIILIACLLIFILSSTYISLFKSKHFYLTIFIILVIFSPVIIWNIQHDWVSVLYQLNSHRSTTQSQGLVLLLKTFIGKILPSLNLMLFAPILALIQPKSRGNNIIKLLLILTIGFITTYILLSSITNIRNTWLAQYLLTSSLLIGWVIQQDNKILPIIYSYISINTVISFLILLNTCLHFIPSENFIFFKLINQFNIDYPKQPKIVINPGWTEARGLFFLQSKPIIYSINCDRDENTYQFWYPELKNEINKNGLKNIGFLDFYDHKLCLEKYFKNCIRQKTSNVASRELFYYKCEQSLL